MNKILKNASISIIAQLISLFTSFILGFIVPKFIDMYQYSYWQTYLLYVGYVGIFHFGLLDGLMLRYSQYDYEELDKRKIRTQFKLLLFISCFFAIVVSVVAFILLSEAYRTIIVIVGIAIIIKNYFTYTSYTFQLTNRISKYAILIIIQRLIYAIIIVLLLILKVNNFIFYCFADLVADFISILIMSTQNKGLYFGETDRLKVGIHEFKTNISAGVWILIANFSSMFIIGSAKMITQFKWDEITFGKVTFGFSVSNIFLTFVSAISIVLFPSLKRMKVEDLPNLYENIRNSISPILFTSLICFFPGSIILSNWLPKYKESLLYLGILLPIIVFDSKIGLLTNNYFKAYRKEKKMLIINLFCIAIGIILFIFSAFVINSLDALLFSVIIIIMMRSIISEISVMKLIDKLRLRDYVIEVIMIVVFILSARYMTILKGFIVYLVSIMVYMIIYRKNIYKIVTKVLRLK